MIDLCVMKSRSAELGVNVVELFSVQFILLSRRTNIAIVADAYYRQESPW